MVRICEVTLRRLRYRYRMHGLDRDWIEAGQARANQLDAGRESVWGAGAKRPIAGAGAGVQRHRPTTRL